MNTIDRTGAAIGLRILVAIASPLPRVRLLSAWRQEDDLEVVGEAANGAQAVELAIETRPDVILCDERILSDPAVQTYARYQSPNATSLFVLLAADPLYVKYMGCVSLAATLSSTAPANVLKQQLLDLVDVDTKATEKASFTPHVPGMESRFMIAGRGTPGSGLPAEPGQRPEPGLVLEQAGQRGAPIGVAARPAERRRPSERLTILEKRLAVMQTVAPAERDSVTGLPDAKVLQAAVQALTEAGCPSAVVIAHLRYDSADGVTMGLGAGITLLRSAGAALRANVRQQDVVCRLDGMSFAVVLPGVEKSTSARPLQRVRIALARVRRKHGSASARIDEAVGVGFWTDAQPPTEPIETAWRQVAAERRAIDSRRGTPT